MIKHASLAVVLVGKRHIFKKLIAFASRVHFHSLIWYILAVIAVNGVAGYMQF